MLSLLKIYLNESEWVSLDSLKIYLHVYDHYNKKKKLWMAFNDPKAFEPSKEFSYYMATNEEFMLGKGRFSTLKIHTT